MAKLSKRYSAVRAKVDRTKVYPAQEALELAKALEIQVRIDAGGNLAHQITTSSARRLPELLRASRIAIRDEGVAPI